ncbi:hypothetical protein BHM03_00029577 [Ensete ventricosum]|nr:hypothetical protein BHM03_00029577 [Ensete ventricosum]
MQNLLLYVAGCRWRTGGDRRRGKCSYSMVAYRRGNRRDRSLGTVKTAMSAEQTLPPRVPPGSKTRRRRLPRLMTIPRFLLGPLIWSQRRQT